MNCVKEKWTSWFFTVRIMVMTHRTQYRNAIVTPYTDGDPGSSEVDSEGASWVDWILTKKLLTILRCDDCLSR